MLSSLEDKLAGAQGAYDSFVEARTVLGDSERTDENPGSKSAIISTKELQWLGLLESKNYIFVSLLDFKLSQWYSKNSSHTSEEHRRCQGQDESCYDEVP